MDEAQARAERAAAALARLDRVKPLLGIEVIGVGPGRSRLAMTVSEIMVNGHGNCHGGMVFTLADAAFGIALNSHGEAGVSAQCDMTFLNPARLGERLVAVAEERAHVRRTRIIDVRVEAPDGRLVALMRGHGRMLGTSVFELAGG